MQEAGIYRLWVLVFIRVLVQLWKPALLCSRLSSDGVEEPAQEVPSLKHEGTKATARQQVMAYRCRPEGPNRRSTQKERKAAPPMAALSQRLV